eukprot:GHVR01096479.1.p1 GENE.GHVR01096479.1~~GHVR01096479.1.p1  ORF type:complete len:471 (+),score=129.14 GHVR01096479.1:202-1614(+)
MSKDMSSSLVIGSKGDRDTDTVDVNAFKYTDNNNIDKNESISENISENIKDFRSLGLCEEMCVACGSLGWITPTPIQREVLPHAFKGNDIIGLAETGSGKTGAFALPVIQSLLSETRRQWPYCVVLAPTRELCVQISQQFQALGASICLTVAVIVGGLDMVEQAIQLARRPHVVVASPGRLVDHIAKTKGFCLKSCRYLILDEADRLLSLDFEDEIAKVVEALPSARTSFLFSATMTSRVEKLQRACLRVSDTVRVEVGMKYTIPTSLKSYIWVVPHKDKVGALYMLLSHLRGSSSMVFVNTCVGCEKLTQTLDKLGVVCISLHGQLTQPHRLASLNQFKAGNFRVLCATEVGSRGLDIPSVDLVVNFDVPLSSKDYIHRVGRTARAGKSGKAFSLITQYDVYTWQRTEQALGLTIPAYTEIDLSKLVEVRAHVEGCVRAAESDIKEGNHKHKHPVSESITHTHTHTRTV